MRCLATPVEARTIDFTEAKCYNYINEIINASQRRQTHDFRRPRMTKSGFIIKRSFQQIFKNPSASGIIIFALTVCTFAALILTAAAADRYADLQKLIELKKQYYFYGEDASAGVTYNDSVTDRETDGKYPILEELFSEDFPGVDSFLDLEAAMSNGKKISAIYSGKEVNSPKAEEMAEGRIYSDGELKSGEYVAVINVSECEDLKIGEKVNIGGAEFELIGKTYGGSSIPLFAALKEGWPVSFGDVTFTDYLTAEQEALLLDTLSSEGISKVKTCFEIWSASDYDEIRRAILSLFILTVISGVIIAGVFGYSVTCRLREFNIYKTLGARGVGFFGIFYIPTLIMLAVSLLLGGAMFKISYPARQLLGITSGFTPAVAALAVFTIIILMILVTLPRYIKLLRQDPKDGEGLT